MDFRDPIHQPIRAEINSISADTQQNQIHRQHPTKGFVLANVILQHIEHVKALPEQE